MTSALGYIIEKTALLISKVFQFFIGLLYNEGHLNMFGYLMLVMLSLIFLTTIIDFIVNFIRDD